MSENIGESLDSLMVGTGGEKVSEATSEEIAARAAVAAQKMKSLRRDEGKAKQSDKKLAKMLPTFSLEILTFVAALIDFNIPSVTILACISLVHKNSEIICKESLKDQKITIENFLPASVFEEKDSANKIDVWWQYIIEMNKASKTIHLGELKTNKKFIEIFSKGLEMILKRFLSSRKITEYNKKELELALNKRGKALFLTKH